MKRGHYYGANKERTSGGNEYSLSYYSLDYFLDAQARLGLKSIELWGGAPHFWLDYMTYSDWGYHNEDPNEAWKRSREMLRRSSEVAQANEITLVMESLRPEESRIVNNLKKTKRMFDEVNHPNLKVMVDTTAMTVAGEKLKD